MFGFIWDLAKDTGSSTGYRVKMLIDNPEITEADFHIFEASEDVYNMQFDPLYKFPLIGEYCFHMVFDKNGVVTELLNSRKGLCNAVYSFGSPRTIASVLNIGDGYIEFTDLAKQFAEGQLVYYNDYKLLKAKEINKGSRISLSRKVTAYCLDWTKDETTFSRVGMDFVKSVLGKNAYWMSICNLYGDNEDFDLINITLNYKKDENEHLGDLAKLGLSREQLTKPQN
jgi:hypothetical protein